MLGLASGLPWVCWVLWMVRLACLHCRYEINSPSPPPLCFRFREGALAFEVFGNSPSFTLAVGQGLQGLQLSWHPHFHHVKLLLEVSFSTITSRLLMVTTLFSDGELRHVTLSGSGSVPPPGVSGDHTGNPDIYTYWAEVKGLPFSLLELKTKCIVRTFTVIPLKQGKENDQRQRRILYKDEKLGVPGRPSSPKCPCEKQQSYGRSEAKTDKIEGKIDNLWLVWDLITLSSTINWTNRNQQGYRRMQ